MMTRFDDFIPFILQEECDYPADKSGQFSKDPDDPGGLTRWGIDKKSHPLVDPETLTLSGALMIYRHEWDEDGCEALPALLGEVFFNACVNCGLGRARKLLAASGSNATSFLEQQDKFYEKLCNYWEQMGKKNPRKYLKGWLARTANLRKFLRLE